MEVEVEEEISNMSSVLHKVADLYASHLMSDIVLVVGETRYFFFFSKFFSNFYF